VQDSTSRNSKRKLLGIFSKSSGPFRGSISQSSVAVHLLIDCSDLRSGNASRASTNVTSTDVRDVPPKGASRFTRISMLLWQRLDDGTWGCS
jgi:hypothetical protein